MSRAKYIEDNSQTNVITFTIGHKNLKYLIVRGFF